MLIFESDCFTCPSEFNRIYLPTDFGVAGFPKMFLRLCKRYSRCPKIILTISDNCRRCPKLSGDCFMIYEQVSGGLRAQYHNLSGLGLEDRSFIGFFFSRN